MLRKTSTSEEVQQLSLEFLFERVERLEKEDDRIKKQLKGYGKVIDYSQEFPGFKKKLTLVSNDAPFRLNKLGDYFTAKQWLEGYKQVILDDNEYRKFTKLVSNSCLLEEAAETKTVSKLSKQYKKRKNINQGSHVKVYEKKHHPILEQAYCVLFEEKEKGAKYLGSLDIKENEIKQMQITEVKEDFSPSEINKIIDFFIANELSLRGFSTNFYRSERKNVLVVRHKFKDEVFAQYCKRNKIALKNEVEITLEKEYDDKKKPGFNIYFSEYIQEESRDVDLYLSKREKNKGLKNKNILKKNGLAKHIISFLQDRREDYDKYLVRSEQLSPRQITEKCILLLELHKDVKSQYREAFLHKSVKLTDNKEVNGDFYYSIFIDGLYNDCDIQIKVSTLKHHPNYKKHLVVFGYQWVILKYKDRAWIREPTKVCNYWMNFTRRIETEYNQLVSRKKYRNKT